MRSDPWRLGRDALRFPGLVETTTTAGVTIVESSLSVDVRMLSGRAESTFLGASIRPGRDPT